MARKCVTIPFSKFHAAGNDFLVVRAENLPAHLAPLAQAMTDRHTGVGADGLLVVGQPRDPSHDVQVRFFNADGSEAEMSGNGIRCVGAFLLPPGSEPHPLRIETLAGVKTLDPVSCPSEPRRKEWVFRVAMGQPIFEPARIPFKGRAPSTPVVGFPLQLLNRAVRVTVISMGNPHCSIFVKDFGSLDWKEVGAQIERHRLFPARTNVEFVRVISPERIEVRFWERGVGETASSGTGSCAAAVAAMLNGYAKRRVRVQTVGGSLEVHWRADQQVYLTGASRLIAQGTYYW